MIASTAAAQSSSGTSSKTRLMTPEQTILSALGNDPVTAPYAFKTARKDGRIILSGRVGTREIHDRAIRLAMTVSPSLDDRLVIDTAAVNRLAATGSPAAAAPYGGIVPASPAPYVYPEPLFGRLDEPFLGFEPPLISFPPWYAAVMARKGDPYGAPNLDPNSPIGPDPGPPRGGNAAPQPNGPVRSPAGGPAVEMTIDPLGVAILRGTVPTDEAAAGIADKASRLPGVTRIVNRLEVRPDPDEPATPIRNPDEPPPPPMPEPTKPIVEPKAAVAQQPAAITPANSVDKRVAQSIERRPALKGADVKAEVRDGVATLTGKVPTALEAMLAFRAAQQTVGVREVIDRLEFKVPDGQAPNPLITRGRPDDVEPYLLAQLRRQLDDEAQVDRIKVAGDRLELKGTIRKADDRPRVEAVLRSMPLLRGFTLDMKLTPE